MTVAAVIDECGLERGLHTGHFGQIDVSAQLLLVLRFEIEFLYAVSTNDDDAGLLGMGGVDEHFLRHIVGAPRHWATELRPGARERLPGFRRAGVADE